MSVLTRGGAHDPDHEWYMLQGHGPLEEQLCFYCGYGCTEPAVYWQGFVDTSIHLHAACALELCIRIIRDVHQIENMSGQRFQLQSGPVVR
jgi:hypothetical protein